MRITIIGGGPAGLYFAILMKKADPAHRIRDLMNGMDQTIRSAGASFFPARHSRTCAPPTRSRMPRSRKSLRRGTTSTSFTETTKISIHGNSFSGIARLRLLKILQRRAEELGVEIHFRHEIQDLETLRNDCDLFVGADGVNSTVRLRYAERFKPDLDVRSNRYIWYGTNQLFHGLTLTFRENDAGVFAAHSYKFNKTTSTFIVECDPQTWERAGFANDERRRDAHLCRQSLRRRFERQSAAFKQLEVDQFSAGKEHRLVLRECHIAWRRTAHSSFFDWFRNEARDGRCDRPGAIVSTTTMCDKRSKTSRTHDVR